MSWASRRHRVKLLLVIQDKASIPGLGRSPGEGNGNPLEYSYLGNPTNKGAWRATAHGVTQSQA